MTLHFRHVVRLLLNMQLYLDLERSAASIRRHWRPGVGLLDTEGERIQGDVGGGQVGEHLLHVGVVGVELGCREAG